MLGDMTVSVVSTFTVFTLIIAHALIIAQLLVWKSKNGNFLMIFGSFKVSIKGPLKKKGRKTT